MILLLWLNAWAFEIKHLDGTKGLFPDELPDRAWVMFGFTRGSQKASTQCSEKFKDILGGYSGIVLEGAPFFLRGMIRRSIGGDIPKKNWPSVFIFEHDADALKKMVGFDKKQEDASYVGFFENKQCVRYALCYTLDAKQICDFMKVTK